MSAVGVSGYNCHERVGYVPTPVKHFSFAMSLIPQPLDDWSFVDIGSGKGRVVLLAMGYPFRRVVGVELAPELHTIAQENLRRYRGARRCQKIELVCGDATTMPLPPGDVAMFVYNPFLGELMRRFLDHLEASLHDTPRRLVLIYSNPVERAAIESRPTFSRLFDGASPYDFIWWGVRRLAIYGAGLETAAGAAGDLGAAPGNPTQR